MRLFIASSLLLALLFSCNNDKVSYEKRESQFYKIVRYKNDSIKSIVEIRDGKPFGTERVYFESGNLKEEKDWFKGEIEGHEYFFFDKTDTIITNDLQDLPYLAVRSRLKSYKFNLEEEDLFEIEFDKNGVIEEYKGNFILFVHPKFEDFTIGDSLKLEIQLPAIHSLNANLGLYEKLSDSVYKKLSSPQLNKLHMRAYANLRLDEEGKRNLALIYEIELKGLVVIDTTFLPSFMVHGSSI